MLVWIARIILGTNKGDVGRGKLTEIEERIFGGDCRGGKYSVVKMKEHLPFSREFNISVVVDRVV